MKKWLCLLALGIIVSLFPGKGTDVGELLPVELVSLTVQREKIVVQTDTGDLGMGETLAEAMENLRAGAPGKVFLETADYLLLSPQTEAWWGQLKTWFRPGTLVYAAGEEVNPEAAVEYLRSHTGGTPLNRLGEETPKRVIRWEGRVKLEE